MARAAAPVRLLPLLVLTAAGCGRLHDHPVAVEAAGEVTANARVAEALGSPVECSRTVRGRANETDGIAHMEFEARGSKAVGLVVAEGKKTRGEWGLTQLDLQPAGGGAKIPLLADLEARTGVDTPAFDPTASPAKPSNAPPPPQEIDIVLPPGPPGQ